MNRHIYRLVAAVLAAMTIVSCNGARRSETFRVLEDVDSYIEARPDSALAVLEGIDKSELTSKELEAKYALLLSQALDKNYIDLQSDSIIAPAVRYYENHGTPDERLLTHYYRGVIYLNAGCLEDAMAKYVEAEKYVSTCKDNGINARLYKAKMSLYVSLYDHLAAIQQGKIASDYFLKDCDTLSYINTINDIAIQYDLINDSSAVAEHLGIIKSHWEILTDLQKSNYYALSLSLMPGSQEKSIWLKLLKDYQSEITDPQLIKWMIVANAYMEINDIDAAAYALEQYKTYDGREQLPYYWIMANILEHKESYKEGINAYKKYIYLLEGSKLPIIESDTKFIEERHQLEIKALQEKEAKIRTALISIIAILCSVIIIYLIRKQLQIRTAEKKQLEIEKQRYEQLYADAIAERDALTKMIEDSNVRDETKAVIRERLEVLNKVIISHITDTSSANKKAFQELEALVADRDSFIESTRLTIEGNNPEFIDALRESGLTDEEINICCLYVIGLKGKDIKTYTNQSRLYIQSAEIRHKLGLTENDTNLSIHLRNMCENEVC